jgi:hypothetical protein
MKSCNPKFGEAVTVIWKKADKGAYGGTEGLSLGILGDEITGKYLIIDRSSYQDSFKSALLFLNILDLKVVPLQEIDLIKKTKVRKRPPGISEEFSMIMEVDYRSNIDFNYTMHKVEKRIDCISKRIGNSQSETYQIGIKGIKNLEGTSINIFCKGTIQIFCNHKNLDKSINWIQKAVELLPDHKRLVLIPTKITYKIHDTFKESSRPTEEVINRIAKAKEGHPVVFPMGWAHRFFGELDVNPLQGLFPSDQPLDNYVFENERSIKKAVVHPDDSKEGKLKKSVDLKFPFSGINVNKYLGAGAPITRLTGLIKTPKDEENLMKTWLSSRSDCWQWLSTARFQGKTIVRDLTINKKAGTYTIDFRKYSGNEF